MKFRKKPVVIDAVQFNLSDVVLPDGVVVDKTSETGYSIDTLQGRALNVSPGDWIIYNMGERYPCKPDIFAATYETQDAVRRYSPEELLEVAHNTLIPADINKRAHLIALIHEFEKPDRRVKA